MQSDASDELYVEMTHTCDPLRSLTDGGERLRQYLGQDGLLALPSFVFISDVREPFSYSLLEFLGFLFQLLVRQLLHLGFKVIDALHDRFDSLQEDVAAGSKEFLD